MSTGHRSPEHSLDRFRGQYEEYIKHFLHPTRNQLKSILTRWRLPGEWADYDERSAAPEPSPIQRTLSRVKRPESVVDKILRKRTDYPKGLVPESFKKMRDSIGARIVVFFLRDLATVDKRIRTSPEFEVSDEEPPIVYISQGSVSRLGLSASDFRVENKESGYVSLHYVLRLRESVIPPEERPWFELQLRTYAEDLWAEIEHILAYKPEKRTWFAVRKQFEILSAQVQALDQHFNFLAEELYRFQKEGRFEEDGPLNAENLPSVLWEAGLRCTQQEISGLLRLLVSRGVNTVGALRSLATTRRLELINRTHRSSVGRAPRTFEVVANLANLRGVEDEDEQSERIRQQITYLASWDSLKQTDVS